MCGATLLYDSASLQMSRAGISLANPAKLLLRLEHSYFSRFAIIQNIAGCFTCKFFVTLAMALDSQQINIGKGAVLFCRQTRRSPQDYYSSGSCRDRRIARPCSVMKAENKQVSYRFTVSIVPGTVSEYVIHFKWKHSRMENMQSPLL